jgi:undecaprenyl pyrophosphate phosphatase UppP
MIQPYQAFSIPIHLTKELAMTSFASPQFSTYSTRSHGSVEQRSEARKVNGSKTLAGMLLAAVLAALLVVADQVIDSWVNGHLLAGWVALWVVVFASMALLAPSLRKMSHQLAGLISRWIQASAQRSMEEKMWEYAKRDPRVMAELQHAWLRSHQDA